MRLTDEALDLAQSPAHFIPIILIAVSCVHKMLFQNYTGLLGLNFIDVIIFILRVINELQPMETTLLNVPLDC